MAKLLIVDDDIRLRKLVRTYGEVEHYECEEAADGLSALEKLQDADFDLVILDVMMPGLDGFETLERIRKTSEIPVIMLTARSEEYDKLTGFGLGVDDYVSKPFSPKELMARVGAVLKRNRKTPVRNSFTYRELEIRPASRIASVAGKELVLAPKEFDLLLELGKKSRYRPAARQAPPGCLGLQLLRGRPHRRYPCKIRPRPPWSVPRHDPDRMGSRV